MPFVSATHLNVNKQRALNDGLEGDVRERVARNDAGRTRCSMSCSRARRTVVAFLSERAVREHSLLILSRGVLTLASSSERAGDNAASLALDLGWWVVSDLKSMDCRGRVQSQSAPVLAKTVAAA